MREEVGSIFCDDPTVKTGSTHPRIPPSPAVLSLHLHVHHFVFVYIKLFSVCLNVHFFLSVCWIYCNNPDIFA